MEQNAKRISTNKQIESDHGNGNANRLRSHTDVPLSNVTDNPTPKPIDNKENESTETKMETSPSNSDNVNNNFIDNSNIQHSEINSNSNHRDFSKPHVDSAAFVEVHPLSNSFMNSNVRNNSLTASLHHPTELNVRIHSHNVRFNSLQDNLNDNQIQNLRRMSQQVTPVQIPIIGYEVMEERARFTIYKLRIDDPRTGLSWMVFRRYTDFVRLYQKLKSEYRNLSLPLPEKRLFRNNFDPSFLDERAHGLQIFVNAVVKKLSADRSVREFFCLDEPPPVGDSEPEAQALFGALEDTVGALKNQIRHHEDALKYMRQKVFYLEEKMKTCAVCNPLGGKSNALEGNESSTSSNGS